MTGSEPRRSKGVTKGVRFTEDEWRRVERRMRIAGTTDFSKFARPALLDGEIRVERVTFDPSVLRAELARIGNNVNQIARHVNAEDAVTFSEMQATRALLRQVQQAIENAAKSGGDDRGVREDAPDQEHPE